MRILSYILFGVGILLITYLIGFNMGKRQSPPPIIETTVETVIDTVRDTILKPRIISKETIREVHDTLLTRDSIPVEVILPIEKTTYEHNDSNVSIKAHISGYKASLDSLSYQLYKHTVIETRTVKSKERGFKFNVGIYGGYGVLHRNADIFIGGGIGYTF